MKYGKYDGDTTSITLPKLFKKTSTGADQFWEIGTVGNVIVTRWGQVNGKTQETTDTIREGKNLGKKNATTAEEQAQLEAQAQWEKKLKKGYVKNIDDAREGKVDEIIEGGVSPMLAHQFDKQGHKIGYPALAQPKFDGHRCIAVVANGKATLWTRTRKPITGLPHIIRDIERLAEESEDANFVLDGELYNHEYRAKFEELSSFIRTPDPKPGHEIVQYHIYDVVNEKSQTSRVADLASFFGSARWSNHDLPVTYGALVMVETVQIEDEDELMLAFDGFLKQGYEGLMVRNAAGYYVNKRSYDLQKVKEFEDAEFEVVGVEEGRGKLAGHAIFVCKTPDLVGEPGKEFRAKMKGETSALKQYFENPALAIGKRLTVKFQGWTNKAGVPRFPVALRFREEI